MTLEHHGIPHEYTEAIIVNEDQSQGHHGYTKLPRLLEINPKGQVPTMEFSPDIIPSVQDHVPEAIIGKIVRRDDGEGAVLTESMDCMIFLNAIAMHTHTQEESSISNRNLISDEALLEDVKRWDKDICSTFYKVLLGSTPDQQKEAFEFFVKSIEEFLSNITEGGYYKSSTSPSIVDFAVIPWILRIVVLEHFRPQLIMSEFMNEMNGDKLTAYVTRMKHLEAVKKTVWKEDQELFAVYERYANGTAQSQVGQAVKRGGNAHDA